MPSEVRKVTTDRIWRNVGPIREPRAHRRPRARRVAGGLRPGAGGDKQGRGGRGERPSRLARSKLVAEKQTNWRSGARPQWPGMALVSRL